MNKKLYLVGCVPISISLFVSCTAIFLCIYSFIFELLGLKINLEILRFYILTLLNAIPGIVMIIYGTYKEEKIYKEEKKGIRKKVRKGQYDYFRRQLGLGYSFNNLPNALIPTCYLIFAFCVFFIILTYSLNVFKATFVLYSFFLTFNWTISLVYLSWILGAIKKYQGDAGPTK